MFSQRRASMSERPKTLPPPTHSASARHMQVRPLKAVAPRDVLD